MKICSIVAEYNPFHNGHLSQIKYIKTKLKPDLIAVFLSGNFTQRGEPACIDKYTRARHAILAGADVVFELPTVFATQTAEIFASGAVKLINSLPFENFICFGAECGDKDAIIKTASAMLNESTEYKSLIKTELKKGTSLLKAREIALKNTYQDFNEEILSSPNNVLGIEYVKAIIKNDYKMGVEVLKRDGLGYNSVKIDDVNPSALSLREAIINGKKSKIKNAVPKFVYGDLISIPNIEKELLFSILSADKKDIQSVIDCAEGLENRIKALIKNNFSLDELLEKLTSKRYTTARIKRIFLSTMLKIDKKLVSSALKKDLYLKVLAISKDKTDILSKLSTSKYPLITRKSDITKLSSVAKSVFEKDVFANDIYSLITKTPLNEFNMQIL